MAGDWIKIEKATPRKPEILAISDILGIHPDHAFGLCFRFWSWCDDQLKNGHAKSVTYVTLNYAICHDGFAEALLKVGWLQSRNGSIEVPNFDRHLSQSAKNRALAKERKTQERSRSERDKSVTREEKRRDNERERDAREPEPVPVVPKTSDGGVAAAMEIAAIYPANGNRYEAARALAARLADGEDIGFIREAVKLHAAAWTKLSASERRFCPGLSTYFAEARYRDDPTQHPWVVAEPSISSPAAYKAPPRDPNKKPWE